MNLKQLLLVAPDNELDASVKPLIEKWDDEPTAIQILEVLDQCVHAALASTFTISTLEMMLNTAIVSEGTSYEEVAKLATWRNV